MWSCDEFPFEHQPWPGVDEEDCLQSIADWLTDVPGGFYMPWPGPDGPAALRQFSTPDEWQSALTALDLDPASAAPLSVRAKYRRSQKLYLLAWVDGDVLKAGELAAFTALELALNDRFGREVADLMPNLKKTKVSATSQIKTPPLADLLDYLVSHRGISDLDFPSALTGGGTAVDRLRKVSSVGPQASRPTLSEIRNRLAHGDPFESLPLGGLLHLVRDLIHFIYT